MATKSSAIAEGLVSKGGEGGNVRGTGLEKEKSSQKDISSWGLG